MLSERPVLFTERGLIKVWSSQHMFAEEPYGVNKDEQRDVDAHQVGNGYKTISKTFGLHKFTVSQIEEN